MALKMESEQYVNAIVDVGQVLLASGAEIYRVEDTVERLALAAGFARAEVFATPTGLFATLVSRDGPVYSRVRRIRRVEANLARIAALNQLSPEFAAQPRLQTLTTALTACEEMQSYSPLWITAAGALGSAAFAVIFGGTWPETVLAGLNGALAMLVMLWARWRRVPPFLASTSAAFAAAALGVVGTRFLTASMDIVILAGVMVLVPGITITTSLRDLLSGELVSGVARAAEAGVTALAVAVGVAAVLGIMGVIPW